MQCKDPEVRPSLGYLRNGRGQGVWSRMGEEESGGNEDREIKNEGSVLGRQRDKRGRAQGWTDGMHGTERQHS